MKFKTFEKPPPDVLDFSTTFCLLLRHFTEFANAAYIMKSAYSLASQPMQLKP